MKTGASEPAVALGSVPRRDVREGDRHAPLGRDEAGQHVRFGQDIAQRHRTGHRIFAGRGQADRRKAESGMIDQCSPSPPPEQAIGDY